MTVLDAIGVATRNATVNLRPLVARWRAMGIPEAAVHARSAAIIEGVADDAIRKARSEGIADGDRAMVRNVANATMAALFERIN